MPLRNALLMILPVAIGPALSGCASSMSYLGQNAPPPEVPVAAVVNAIKCEVNDFFLAQQKSDQTRAFRLKIDKTALAKIKLNLHVAQGGGLAFSQINVSGTPLQALVSVNPNAAPFAVGGSATSSIGVEVSLTMEQSASRTLDCSSKKVTRGKGLALKDWLTKLMDQSQGEIMADGPTTRLAEIVLTTNFEVAGTASISPAIAIIPVLVPPTLTASATNGNQLQITLVGDNDHSGPPITGGWGPKTEPSKTSAVAK